jgi:hypothetical protein
MKKIYVKWTFTDDYGYPQGARYEWFDTIEEAEMFKAKKKKGNGGYFYVYKTEEGNFEEYKRMIKLTEELAMLKEKF